MKHEPPSYHLRKLLAKLCRQYNLSPQTWHSTIAILMDKNLPENANQDIDIMAAALNISHKLYETTTSKPSYYGLQSKQDCRNKSSKNKKSKVLSDFESFQ